MSKTLGVLVYEDSQPIDFIGPWEVFSLWKSISQETIHLYLISEQGGYVSCVNDITIKTHYDFNQAPVLDYLLIPGGKGRLNEVNNPNLISFIQKQAENTQYILSVCTGMFLLYQAGLLHDLEVTTYWRALPEAKLLANIRLIEERIVKNKTIWLAGGVSSGVDLAFEFIKELEGKDTAGQVQLLYENFPSKTIYCTAMTSQLLPVYANGIKEQEPHLPQYIKRILEEKN